MARPRKDARGKTRSVYLSPESEQIIEQGGYQTNLSAFIDGLIRHTSADSPVFIAIKIERLSKDIAGLQEKLSAATVERDILQAQLNLYKQRGASDDQKRDDARMELLRKWDATLARDSLRGQSQFAGWLSGPANVHLIRDAGFQTPDEVVEWCRAEAVRR